MLRTPLLACAIILVLVAAASPAAAGTDATAESQFLSLVNQARARHGLAPLSMAEDLRADARSHSQDMADQGRLSHQSGLGSGLCCWRRIAENVGTGSQVGDIHQALMESAGHRANILMEGAHDIGIGVDNRGGRLWVTQVFRLRTDQPASSAPPAAPPPAPTATPPAPAPPPQPTAEPAETAPGRTEIALARLEGLDSGQSIAEVLDPDG